MLLTDASLEGHVSTWVSLTFDSTFLVVDAWAEGEHLMVSIARKDVLELVRGTIRRLTANRGYTLLRGVIMSWTMLTMTFIAIWFATEPISRITGSNVVEQRVVTLVHTELSLGLEAIPAVQNSVIIRIEVVGIIVKVTWRGIVFHIYQWSRGIDHGFLFILAG